MHHTHFNVKPIRPGGWAEFLARILEDEHEVGRVMLGSVGTRPKAGITVMGIYLNVFTPAHRLRALRLELERLLPSEAPFEIMFSRTDPSRQSRLAALLRAQGALLYNREATDSRPARLIQARPA